MYKLCMAALLALPMITYAQSVSRSLAPAGSFTESMVYVFNDAQYGHNRSLFGWSAVPAVNLTPRLAMEGDVASLYVRSIYPGQSRLVLAAGPRFNFAPRYKVMPFVFAEGGEMRVTTQYSPVKDWNPVAKGGFGFVYHLSRGVAMTLVPGEYLGQYLDNGAWNHSYTSRVGITWNLYKRGSGM